METKKKPGRPKKIMEAEHNGKEEKGQQAQVEDVLEQSAPVPAAAPAPRRLVERPETPDAIRIAESRKALEHPLAPGQKFFESPDGEIIVGDAEKTHVWSRHMNHGKGGFINPMR